MYPSTSHTIPSPQSLTVAEWEAYISSGVYFGIQVDGSRNSWIFFPEGATEGDAGKPTRPVVMRFVQEHDTRGGTKGVCKAGLFSKQNPTTCASC